MLNERNINGEQEVIERSISHDATSPGLGD